jgi:hypothetical protein
VEDEQTTVLDPVKELCHLSALGDRELALIGVVNRLLNPL